ncbi:unnamed protein product [Ectocarpus sp. CCAP 1310/34]|nr:unnamed protein product [Ectocarpus sp. CCAP 1310/34]
MLRCALPLMNSEERVYQGKEQKASLSVRLPVR